MVNVIIVYLNIYKKINKLLKPQANFLPKNFSTINKPQRVKKQSKSSGKNPNLRVLLSTAKCGSVFRKTL